MELSITGFHVPYVEAVRAQLDQLGLLDNIDDSRCVSMVLCTDEERWSLLAADAADPDRVAIAVLADLELDGYARALSLGASGVVYLDTPSAMTADAVRAAIHGEVLLPKQAARRLAELARREKPITGLDDREIELIQAVARGEPIVEIARNRYFSERTVRRHLQSVYLKLGAKNRAEAIAVAARMGFVDGG